MFILDNSILFFVEKILGPTFSDHRFLGLRFQVLGFHVFSGQLRFQVLGFQEIVKPKTMT